MFTQDLAYSREISLISRDNLATARCAFVARKRMITGYRVKNVTGCRVKFPHAAA